MNLFGIRRALIGAGICSVGSLAMAADEAAGPKISSEVRASWESTDNGLYKVSGSDAPARTSNFGMERLKLQLKGNLDQSTDYRLRLDFNGAEVVDFAYGTWWIDKMIGLRLGKDKVQQGGVFNMTNGLYDLSTPIYASNKPHAAFLPMLDLELKIAGTISLQFFDDHSKYNKWHTTDQQPAIALSYVGDFNGIMPRAQIGMYDNNHSTYISLGSGFKVAGVEGYANYIMDRRSHKDSLTATDPKDKIDVLSSLELDGKYSVNKQIQPFLHFSMFNRTQEGTDLKVNSITGGADGSVALNWDDNGTVIGIGSFYHATEHASPFLAIDMRSGKFGEKLSPTSTTAETQRETSTRLGMALEF